MPQRIIRTLIENQVVHTLSPRVSVAGAAQLMKQYNIGAVMVVDDGRLVGLFTERDALQRVLAEVRDAGATRLAEVMTSDPQTIHPDKPFGHALHMMFEGGFRHMPVVEDGRPVGMVSARDALGAEVAEFESELRSREHIREILG